MKVEQFFQTLDELFAKGELEKVEPYLISCLEEAGENKEYGMYITIGNEMIGFYRSISAFERAFQISEDVLLLMEELKLEESEHFATTLLNVATAYRAAGRLKEAHVYYVRALKIYEEQLKPNDYRFAGLYNNMSLLLEEMGENEKAALFLEKAIDIVSVMEDARMEYASSLTNLALIYFKLNKYEQAKELLSKSVSVFAEAGENTDPHYSAALAAMAESYYHEGRLEKALAYYDSSLSELKKHFGENASYALLCDNCAAICSQLGDTKRQKDYQEASARVLKSLN